MTWFEENPFYGYRKAATEEQYLTFISKLEALDTESLGFRGKLLITTYTDGNEAKYFTGKPNTIIANTVNMLFNSGGRIYLVHNLGYDLPYFIRSIIDRALSCGYELNFGMRTQNVIYSLQVFKDKDRKNLLFELRDSMALFAHGLDKMTATFSPELPKLPKPFDYSVYPPIVFDPGKADHLAYALRDVESLKLAYTRLVELMFTHFGIIPTATAAGSAIKAWQVSIPKTDNDNQKLFYWHSSEISVRTKLEREAYRGGFTWPNFTSVFNDVKCYDFNSSYPASMLLGVPDAYKPSGEITEFIKGLPGVYRCHVVAPDGLRIPVLGTRNKQGQTIWPAGEFETTITSNEIEFARSVGYEVEVINGYVYDGLIYPFNDFIEKCRQLRYEFKDTPIETIAKLLQNSAYGRFGMRNKRYVVTNDEDIIWQLEDANLLQDYNPFFGGYESREFVGAIPIWAAWITAQSRLALLKVCYEIGVENVIYTDTDSIFTTAEMPPKYLDEKEYGKLKLEKEYDVFRAHAPKVYAGIKKGEDKFSGVCKGLKVSSYELEAIFYNRQFSMIGLTTVSNIGAILRGADWIKENQHRNLTNNDTSTTRVYANNGMVLPIVL